MKKLMAIIALAGGVLLANTPVFAQQGSNQAADYALSWSAARGGYGGFGHAYARYGYGRHYQRWHWR